MIDMAPILIAYDGSELAKAGIRDAGWLLRPGRKAIVLTVWDFPAVTGFAPMSADDAFRASLVKDAERTAAEGARLAEQHGFEATPETSEGGPTWERIVKAAEQHGSDVIVLGSHGRSGIAYAVLGSVATAVAHHAPCPVLIAQGEDVTATYAANGAQAHTSPRVDARKEIE